MKVLVFLGDGFEEVEALTVVDYLRRMDIEVDMASISENLNVKGAHGIEVVGNKLSKNIDPANYEAVVLPGGLPGAENLRRSKDVVEAVRVLNRKGRLLAAICAGPIVLEEAGVLEGKNFTCYPGFEVEIKTGKHLDKDIVKDGNIVTGKGPALAGNFSLEIVEYLLGKDKKEELKKDILFNK